MNVDKIRWIGFSTGVGGFIAFFGGVLTNEPILGVLGMIALIMCVILILCTFSAGEVEEEKKEELKELEKLYEFGAVVNRVLTICKEFYNQMPFNVIVDSHSYTNCAVYKFQVKGRQFKLTIFGQDKFGRLVRYGSYAHTVQFGFENLFVGRSFLVNDVMENSVIGDFLKEYDN